MDRFVTQQKNSTSEREKPSTSETTGEGAAPAADVATNKGKRKREKTRKYTENYLKFRFTKETADIELPMCVLFAPLCCQMNP